MHPTKSHQPLPTPLHKPNPKSRLARTKINNIKNLSAPILRDTGEQLAIRARRDAYDRGEVRAVVLHELDACFLLFPELEVAVGGGRY